MGSCRRTMLIEKASRPQNQFAGSSARSTHPGREEGWPLALPSSFLFLSSFPHSGLSSLKKKSLKDSSRNSSGIMFADLRNFVSLKQMLNQGAPFGAGGNSNSSFGDGESWDSGSEVVSALRVATLCSHAAVLACVLSCSCAHSRLHSPAPTGREHRGGGLFPVQLRHFPRGNNSAGGPGQVCEAVVAGR